MLEIIKRILLLLFPSIIRFKHYELNVNKDTVNIKNTLTKECIRINKKNRLYIYDIVKHFKYYFSSVEPVLSGDYMLVDYSYPHLFKVKGFDLHEVMFTSYAEAITSTNQYIQFAKLNENSVVIDLGAYSGLTSILFDMEISKNNKNAAGKVIAVDADIKNEECIKYNFAQYKSKTNRNIEYLYAAITDTNGEINFASDGTMGATAFCRNKFLRGANIIKVPCLNLVSLAKKYNLEKVDFIKCDVEGAEKVIFNNKEFFDQYNPKIIIEIHNTDKKCTTSKIVRNKLNSYGYHITEVQQEDFNLPLFECIRES